MADKRVVYLGKSSAIEANALEGFTPSDVDELLEAVEGSPRLEAKIRRARDWQPAALVDEVEDVPEVRALAAEALSEPTLGPASDRDAAQYWANLARKLAQAVSARKPSPEFMEQLRRNNRTSNARKATPGLDESDDRLAAANVRVGAVVRSAVGTIACRYDEIYGTVFGDERPFAWSKLADPVQVLWSPIGAPVEETMEVKR